MASFCGVSLWHQRSWLGGLYYLEGIAMTQDEIQEAILQVCKVSGNDSDFNILGFYALCDRLVELGAAAEREACAQIAHDTYEGFGPHAKGVEFVKQHIAIRIRERGAP